MHTMKNRSFLLSLAFGAAVSGGLLQAAQVVPTPLPMTRYPDGWPAAQYRLNATDQGRVLLHGDGPAQCDELGAREAIVFRHRGTYYLHYDGAGPTGWLACLATSKDLVHWTKHGPAIELGKPGDNDAGTASSPWVCFDGKAWHMFYVGSVGTTPPLGSEQEGNCAGWPKLHLEFGLHRHAIGGASRQAIGYPLRCTRR
jgi:hypothetical protein